MFVEWLEISLDVPSVLQRLNDFSFKDTLFFSSLDGLRCIDTPCLVLRMVWSKDLPDVTEH